MKRWLERWLLAVWYGNQRWGKYLLLPLTAVYCLLSWLNRTQQLRQQVIHPIPVIVVGNITAGGTGKTPLVIALVALLRQAGFNPGVVSRGFGSKGALQAVTAHSLAAEVGDEPLLIAQRTGAPVVVGRERNQAITQLRQQYACDVVLSDDGLQHYHMGRAIEICVVDGQRQFGNGWCLPSGALREPISRLQRCDFVLVNGETLQVRGDTLFSLQHDQSQALAAWAGKQVHVVTGIGNPQRFLAGLHAAGLQFIPHLYPDHYAFTGAELQFADDLPVLMTEKDAVKCRQFAAPNAWYLPIQAVLDEDFTQALLSRLQGMHHG